MLSPRLISAHLEGTAVPGVVLTPSAQEVGSAKAFSPSQWPYWDGSGAKYCKRFFFLSFSVDNRETLVSFFFFLSSLMRCVGVKKVRIVGQGLCMGLLAYCKYKETESFLRNDVMSCGQMFFLGQPKYCAGGVLCVAVPDALWIFEKSSFVEMWHPCWHSNPVSSRADPHCEGKTNPAVARDWSSDGLLTVGLLFAQSNFETSHQLLLFCWACLLQNPYEIKYWFWER